DDPVDSRGDILGDSRPDALLDRGEPVVESDGDIAQPRKELTPSPILLLRTRLESAAVEHEHCRELVTAGRRVDVGREDTVAVVREADVPLDLQILGHRRTFPEPGRAPCLR